MQRLTWWGRRDPDEPEDRGAIAAVVGLLFGSGLLLGLAALVIDVGLIADEGEQLQSGADAAAWAVAEGCITAPDGCGDTGLAARFASANVRDGRAGVTLTVCTAGCQAHSRTREAPCPDLPPGLDGPFAEVRTTTLNPDGSTLLPPRFASALAGNRAGTPVASCSQVAWGVPESLRVSGLAVSACDVEAGGGAFGVPDLSPDTRERSGAIPADLDPPVTPVDRGLSFTVGGETACDTGDRARGVVWTAETGDDCRLDTSVGGVLDAGTFSPACRQALTTARADREPLLVAVHDEPVGATATFYTVAGFAALVVTGWSNLPGLPDAPSWLRADLGEPDQPACAGAATTQAVPDPEPSAPPSPAADPVPSATAAADDDYGTLPDPAAQCLYGYFTQMFAPRNPPEFGAGPDYGVTRIGRIG